jgi:hypothetical protein
MRANPYLIRANFCDHFNTAVFPWAELRARGVPEIQDNILGLCASRVSASRMIKCRLPEALQPAQGQLLYAHIDENLEVERSRRSIRGHGVLRESLTVTLSDFVRRDWWDFENTTQ